MRKISLFICISFIFPFDASSQFQLEKVGIVGGINWTHTSFSDSEGNDKNGKTFKILETRIGGKFSFKMPGRFTFETGLNLDHLLFNDSKTEFFRRNHFTLKDSHVISLIKHRQLNISLPTSILMQTYITQKCVTYLKLSVNNNFTIFEEEKFETQPNSLDLIPRSKNTPQDSNDFKFQYFGTDIDFGFGTYWQIKGIDLQFCLEPKMTLYRYKSDNYINELNNKILYNADSDVYSNIGFEITAFKRL